MRGAVAISAVMLFAAACARESADGVAFELQRLEAQSLEGVAKIERALGDPMMSSSELGEGMHLVETAARSLAALEADQRAGDVEQLMAIVAQARAWDDVATVFSSVQPTELDSAQRAVWAKELDDKAFPAKIAARTSYARALEQACRLGLEHHPVFVLIVDGVTRYGGSNEAADSCAHN